MSELDQNVSDNSENLNSVQDPEKKNEVSYETYRRTVEKEKQLREKSKTLEAQLESYRQKELESQGKYEEVVSSLRKKIEDLENQNKEVRGNFVLKTVDSAIEKELVKRGCINTRDALGLLTNDDYSMLEVDEKYNVSQDRVKTLIDSFQQQREYMFKPREIKVNDSVPLNSGFSKPKVDLSKMSTKELIDFAVKNEKILK